MRSSAHVCVTGNLHLNDRSAEKISGFRFGFRNCIFDFIDRKRFLWKRPPSSQSADSCSEFVCTTSSTRQRRICRPTFHTCVLQVLLNLYSINYCSYTDIDTLSIIGFSSPINNRAAIC